MRLRHLAQPCAGGSNATGSEEALAAFPAFTDTSCVAYSVAEFNAGRKAYRFFSASALARILASVAPGVIAWGSMASRMMAGLPEARA